MRFRYRRANIQMQESDRQLIEEVLSSETFILIDLFFWSLLMTLMTFTIHYTLIGAILIFISSYVFGISLFYSLKRWLREPLVK
ncbi:hypothetical protein J2Z40_001821 [Cytobacillus eiseniae]|uniref:Uncharacterized protein n=1 Tax=Cytobacillus eiseniae TaxID=762947 RepID=A0ABS4RG06_9BACI|nr:hypothetical protein [Cytobacillus eiseniae]MBP2241259.1 hypothetical protein [Cytobacillus eiseniae]